jgi:rod shape determining protein RodA
VRDAAAGVRGIVWAGKKEDVGMKNPRRDKAKGYRFIPSFARIKTSYLAKTDWMLWLPCLFLSVAGLVLIRAILDSGFSHLLRINSRNFATQLTALLMGIAAAYLLSRINYKYLAEAWVLYVPPVYAMVLLTFLLGVATPGRPGARRWLSVPIINMSIQPAEFLRIAFILAFAYHILKVHNKLNRPVTMALLFLHGLVPVALIQLQGDSGSALLVGLIFLTMLFVAGIHWHYITGLLLTAGGLVPVLWNHVLNPFQRNRILALINQSPEDRQGLFYQPGRALDAIRAGGLRGVGLRSPDIVYVPEMHNDFIFAFAVNALGFLGALAIIAAISALCIRLVANILYTDDLLGRVIGAGVLAMFFFSAMINMGMCVALLPVIGNPLPFVSDGGSSVLANFMAAGLALSVHMHGRQKKKTDDFAL